MIMRQTAVNLVFRLSVNPKKNWFHVMQLFRPLMCWTFILHTYFNIKLSSDPVTLNHTYLKW